MGMCEVPGTVLSTFCGLAHGTLTGRQVLASRPLAHVVSQGTAQLAQRHRAGRAAILPVL